MAPARVPPAVTHARALAARPAASADTVLDPNTPNYGPRSTLTLLTALRHRSAPREALENRDEVAANPTMGVPAHCGTAVHTHVHRCGPTLAGPLRRVRGSVAELDAGFQLPWK